MVFCKTVSVSCAWRLPTYNDLHVDGSKGPRPAVAAGFRCCVAASNGSCPCILVRMRCEVLPTPSSAWEAIVAGSSAQSADSSWCKVAGRQYKASPVCRVARTLCKAGSSHKGSSAASQNTLSTCVRNEQIQRAATPMLVCFNLLLSYTPEKRVDKETASVCLMYRR